MGIYSTMSITREDAIREILSRLETAKDEEVAEALFQLTGTFYNFWIVESYDDVLISYEEGCLD